jgi:phage host-nuclease inhibitor protein Gam
MGLSKVGKLTLTLNRYDAEIEALKREIIRLQRERVKASIDAQREIDAESERRSKAKTAEAVA